jgi:hypothetical protein
MKRTHANLLSISLLVTLGSVSVGIEAGSAVPPETLEPIPLKDLDGHFPLKPAKSLDAWKERAEIVRRQVMVSLGLWPKPTMAQLQPVIHSTRSMDGYSISKVYFESLPGLFVTGSLFTPIDRVKTGKPKNGDTKYPAILSPHGHWPDGRFYWASDREVDQLLATGAERFESAAHNHMQARSVQLARMGCVVFQYDMLGYADSQQINMDRAHLFGINESNPLMQQDQWLLYSAKAEGHLQSIMALQTINSLQAFEFLANRTDVDASRIAITGASGGGTQSFITAVVEPRIAAAFPAVMVSTGMQGGCTCENASCLRVETGNIELAALIAPRPLGITAADDWTRTVPQDGFPELQQIYSLFDAKDKVQLFPAVHFPHNFNHVARVSLYGFINRSFGLGLKEPVLERDFEVLKREDLSVWDQDHPRPESGIEFEAKLVSQWEKDVSLQIQKSPDLARQGWESLLQPANTLASSLDLIYAVQPDGHTLLTIQNQQGVTVGQLSMPKSQLRVVPDSIQLTSLDLTREQTSAPKSLAAMLAIGDANGFGSATEQPRVKNPRLASCYTYGYNAPQLIRRLAVLVRVVDELSRQDPSAKLILISPGSEGFLASAIAILRPQSVGVSNGNGAIAFEKIESIYDPNFVPGSLRYGPLTETR